MGEQYEWKSIPDADIEVEVTDDKLAVKLVTERVSKIADGYVFTTLDRDLWIIRPEICEEYTLYPAARL
jgi:hypothetical protein